MTMTAKRNNELPTAPDYLSDAAQSWWLHIVSSFEMESHHLELLRLACECLDRRERARQLLEAEGLTVTDPRGVVRPHPAVSIMRDSGSQLMRCIRELNLDVPAPESRPPSGRNYSHRR